jgi:HD-like signal output (HDOD) protein
MQLLAHLLKLLGRPRPAGSGPVQAAGSALPGLSGCEPVPAAAPDDTAAPHRASDRFDADVDRRFTACLLGVSPLRGGPADAAERRVVERLEQLAGDSRNSDLVPRLPVVLPRLIGLIRRDDVSPRELAERLSHDPTLVGELVRLANSPRYRAGRDIANLQEAVIVLGQRGLVQLVISASMRPIFSVQQGRFSRSAGTRVWDLTERCAYACAYLRGNANDRFQAYLAGMVVNIGLIAALRALDADYHEPRRPDSEQFHDALSEVSAKLSARIARQWDFPSAVCEAVEQRCLAQPGTGGEDLSRALHTADRIGKWHVLLPGLADSALDGLNESERRCYAELERAFGGLKDRPPPA